MDGEQWERVAALEAARAPEAAKAFDHEYVGAIAQRSSMTEDRIMTPIEKICRTLCEQDGNDPDQLVYSRKDVNDVYMHRYTKNGPPINRSMMDDHYVVHGEPFPLWKGYEPFVRRVLDAS